MMYFKDSLKRLTACRRMQKAVRVTGDWYTEECWEPLEDLNILLAEGWIVKHITPMTDERFGRVVDYILEKEVCED